MTVNDEQRERRRTIAVWVFWTAVFWAGALWFLVAFVHNGSDSGPLTPC